MTEMESQSATLKALEKRVEELEGRLGEVAGSVWAADAYSGDQIRALKDRLVNTQQELAALVRLLYPCMGRCSGKVGADAPAAESLKREP
jgi:hypothetical protein